VTPSLPWLPEGLRGPAARWLRSPPLHPPGRDCPAHQPDRSDRPGLSRPVGRRDPPGQPRPGVPAGLLGLAGRWLRSLPPDLLGRDPPADQAARSDQPGLSGPPRLAGRRDPSGQPRPEGPAGLDPLRTCRPGGTLRPRRASRPGGPLRTDGALQPGRTSVARRTSRPCRPGWPGGSLLPGSPATTTLPAGTLPAPRHTALTAMAPRRGADEPQLARPHAVAGSVEALGPGAPGPPRPAVARRRRGRVAEQQHAREYRCAQNEGSQGQSHVGAVTRTPVSHVVRDPRPPIPRSG